MHSIAHSSIDRLNRLLMMTKADDAAATAAAAGGGVAAATDDGDVGDDDSLSLDSNVDADACDASDSNDWTECMRPMLTLVAAMAAASCYFHRNFSFVMCGFIVYDIVFTDYFCIFTYL